MPNASELGWGWKKESIEAPALWGARMYVESWRDTWKGPSAPLKRQLVILPDRMCMLGEGTPRHELEKVLDAVGGGLDTLRSLAKRGDLDVEHDHLLLVTGAAIHIHIYGGYVYVTAEWRPDL